MKRWIVAAALAGALALFIRSQQQNPAPPTAAPAARTALRITFGEKQERETDYSGTITLSAGTVAEIIPWRFFGDDRTQGPNGWHVTTRRANFENQPDHPIPIATPGPTQNIVPKGVTAVLDAPASAAAN